MQYSNAPKATTAASYYNDSISSAFYPLSSYPPSDASSHPALTHQIMWKLPGSSSVAAAVLGVHGPYVSAAPTEEHGSQI
jgi:hypothetical protein